MRFQIVHQHLHPCFAVKCAPTMIGSGNFIECDVFSMLLCILIEKNALGKMYQAIFVAMQDQQRMVRRLPALYMRASFHMCTDNSIP